MSQASARRAKATRTTRFGKDETANLSTALQARAGRTLLPKVKGIRFATLDAICRVLDCEPGNILEYRQTDGAEEPEIANPVRAFR
ncbi:MAG: helix-turn-helix domain-containing protein [Pseudomonadota bacterium]|nr:helix-turn-helix domain-containing protein [Pseudomonadota bacterium]